MTKNAANGLFRSNSSGSRSQIWTCLRLSTQTTILNVQYSRIEQCFCAQSVSSLLKFGNAVIGVQIQILDVHSSTMPKANKSDFFHF